MLKFFQKPKRLLADTDTQNMRYGSFSASPFERGFGSTVGTALRRVLLSSIEGAAITAVRIEGVEHEFSPIPGVVEDATDIILNLKQVPFKMTTDAVKTVRVSVDTPGDIMSSQIQTDADVEVLDGNIRIATVSEGGKLSIDLRLRQNRGYISAERNSDDDLPMGYIPVDSVHTPVYKVNFRVETTKQGHNAEFDKLQLELWTNGAIAPVDAVGQAAKLLKDHMAIFINFEDLPDYSDDGSDRAAAQGSEILNRSVEELELSVRSYNCLKNANIQTIGDLVVKTEAEMLRTKNFGRKSLNEIREILGTLSLSFGMKIDASGRLIAPSGSPVALTGDEDDDIDDIDEDDETDDTSLDS
jgi:DNA-directed RNA polymerase subunit alpha